MPTFVTRTGFVLASFFIFLSAAAQTLQLPAGFSFSVVAEGLGGARHIAVTKQGGVYVKLSRLKDGKGIIYLKDAKKDGKYTQQLAFGDYPGTGICIKGNYLYASSNDDVYRYQLNNNGDVINPDKPEKIITGLVNHNRDNSKSIVLDNNGNIYVNVGSYANACLIDPNSKQAPNPCPLLDSVGGIWQFKANKLNQHYKDAVHYATGFKNVVGLDWNTQTNSLFIMQHGRGDLNSNFPNLYTVEQDHELPAETMYEVRKGADGGWPYEYYDQFQHKKILAPEYGGDGKKPGTHKAIDPKVVFPAHLGPNGLLFYTGAKFPAKYKNGAFIAFHGKSPELQKGYMVAFVPFVNGKPAGKYEIFADNFLINKDQHKPCGLAQGSDGALYISDDSNGSLYKVQYGK
ncbi:MAG: PQQ-dependent sugar dehydrogenase [Chitinophagaceae bacterium]